jgi:predicted GNAT family acetyltransferase
MNDSPLLIRPATGADCAALLAFDELHTITPELLATGEIFVAVGAADRPVAYARFNHTFFWKGWVATLVVHPGHRRRGVACALLRQLETVCRTRKMFVSTSLRNVGMQAVLDRCGYRLTGVIDNLGPEPELFYFKQIEPAGAASAR